MRAFLLLALLSSQAFADDCVSCIPALNPFKDVDKAVAALQATTAVNCVDELKKQANDEYIENFSKLPKKTLPVKGLKLEGSAEELDLLSKMLGTNAKDKALDDWSKTKDCKTVLCALTKVYDSEEAAQRALNIGKRNGYLVSVKKDFNGEDGPIGQRFSPEEIQVIDLAYKRLPPNFKKLKTLQRLQRLPDGFTSPKAPNAAAYAIPGYHSSYYESEGEITFLEEAFTKDKAWGPSVAVHELSHHHDFTSATGDKQFGFSESPAFMKLSGWKKSEVYEVGADGKRTLVTKWEHDKDKKFVSDYSKTNPHEDLAEASSNYVYEPKLLKTLDPEKYEFVKKNMFGGREYMNEPEMNLNDEEILKKCIADAGDIALWGKNEYLVEFQSDCLDKYIKDFTISDKRFCEFNPALLKNFLFDKISDVMNPINKSLLACDLKVETNKTECVAENDFSKACTLNKCNLDERIKSKVKVGKYVDHSKVAMAAIVEKVGKTTLVTTALIAGLNDKSKISDRSPLEHQRNFIDGAQKALGEKFEKDNFKFESKDSLNQMLQNYIMFDKPATDAISTFKDTVIKGATKSKEANRELIKKWAATQSMDETPLFDTLAETLIKYSGKGILSR